MEGNGDIGSFEYYFGHRLQQLMAAGFSLESLQTLRENGQTLTDALVKFRAQRQALTASKKFSAQGLQEELAALAQSTAGDIRRTMKNTAIADGIRQLQAKLQPKVNGDPTERLLRFWQQMEIRATFERLGLTRVNPETGTLTLDTIKGNFLYHEAMARGDVLAMEALEEWPTGALIDAELRMKGQAQRQVAVDPIAAQKLQELETFQQAWEQTLKDALQELPLPQDDHIARMAQGDAGERNAHED